MMGDKLMTKLVTEQSFDPPQTAASETLKKAAIAYHKGEMIKSANLFLNSWRILDIEHKNYLDGRYDLLPPWNTDISKLDHKCLARECRARVLMGYCALADLALACLGITGKYKFKDVDGYDSYTLDRFGLSNDNFGRTTTEDLDIDGKIWPKGSSVYCMFRLADSMGWNILQNKSFAEAAHGFACRCYNQLEFCLDDGDGHCEFREAIRETSKKIMDLAEKNMTMVE